jgi:microcystin-dependent protein
MVQFKTPLTSTSSATDTVAVLCTVREVDLNNLVASVVDQVGTNRKVSLKVLPGKPISFPAIGERWVISREYGDWMFIASVGVTPTGPSYGPQGPQGVQGPQGATGPQGTQGPQGLTEPAGVIKMYGGASAPTGFLLCDGSAVSRTTYSALFTAISTTYGVGDGSTTFNLPNFTNSFPRGNTPGVGAGADTHSHTSAAHSHTSAAHSHTSAAHSHPLSSAGAAHITVAGGLVDWAGSGGIPSWTATARASGTSASGASHGVGAGLDGNTDSTTPGATGTTTPADTGTTTPANTGTSNNIPVYTGVNFIIKT